MRPPHSHLWRAAARALLFGAALLGPGSALAGSPEAAPLASGGRPEVRLDHLEFPGDVEGARQLEKHLKRELRRAAWRADWGAGSGNKIEFRYRVTKLVEQRDGNVLRITCVAEGKLPGGQTAKSSLTFGGRPGERTKLLKRVLGIVAEGVITRLSELERKRRGLC